jgi:hypothetical protein
VAAYQPKGAASLAESYVNLPNPGTNDAAPGVAPTHSPVTGWGLNGTTQYLNAIPVGASYCVLVRFSGVTNTGGAAVGVYDGTNFFQIKPRESDITHRVAYGSTFSNKATGYTAGVMGLAGNELYINGVSNGTYGGSWSGGVTTLPLAIGSSRHPTLTAYVFIAGNIQALAIYSTTLDAAQVAQVSTAMAAL